MADEKWVLEWSQKQNAFHLQPLAKLLSKNQACFIDNTSHSYILLMVGEKDACCRMADSWRDRLDQRTSKLSLVP